MVVSVILRGRDGDEQTGSRTTAKPSARTKWARGRVPSAIDYFVSMLSFALLAYASVVAPSSGSPSFSFLLLFLVLFSFGVCSPLQYLRNHILKRKICLSSLCALCTFLYLQYLICSLVILVWISPANSWSKWFCLALWYLPTSIRLQTPFESRG